jgi:hypothetical protein
MKSSTALLCATLLMTTAICRAQSDWDTNYPGDDGSPYPTAMQVVATNGTLYASTSNGIVCWTRCAGWRAFATFVANTSINGTQNVTGVNCLSLSGNDLYVAGAFSAVTNESGCGVNATNIAVCDLVTRTWAPVGNTSSFGTNIVTGLAVDANQNVYIALYAAGYFPPSPTGYPGYRVNSTNLLLIYTNNQWSELGGALRIYEGYSAGDGIFGMFASGLDVYFTGTFDGGFNGNTWIGSTNVIKWNGESNAWQAVNGVSGGVSIWGNSAGVVAGANSNYDAGVGPIAVSGSNVFVTGNWMQYGGNGPTALAGSNITFFSTNGTWLGFSDWGMYGSNCFGTSFVVQNGSVFLGGTFPTIGSSNVNSIAEWTGGSVESWEALGTGTNVGVCEYEGFASTTGSVFALAADADAIYVIGNFFEVGGYQFNGPIYDEVYGPGPNEWTASRWTNGPNPDPCSCVFANTESMNKAVKFQSATLLPDGDVLVAGGYGTTYQTNAELYDWLEGAWINAGPLNTARVFQPAVLLPNGLVLVAGGQGSSSPVQLASAELYNPTNGRWANTGSMANHREYHTLTLLPTGLVLAAGGYNGSILLSNAELYTPSTGTWTNTGSMPVAIESATATVLPNGLVLVAGAMGLLRLPIQSYTIRKPGLGQGPVGSKPAVTRIRLLFCLTDWCLRPVA